MKITAMCSIFLLFLAAIALTLPDYSEAARMGGGRSFGSRPSMSTPAQRPGPTQQATRQTGQPAAPMGGMMGGLFGGLLAGTLLGSLLGGGAGGGGGFLDIILFGILAYVAWRLFKRFRQNQGQQTAPAGGYGGQSAFRQQTWGAPGGSGFTPTSAQPNVDVPAGFDVDEFLKGAKATYTRMQQSWDRRDLNDIAHFATPTVLRELEEQARQDPNPSHTEILLINANLVGMENEGANQRAQVYFDVMMREDPSQPNATPAREIWHFLRIGPNGNWKLDGIQQVE